jgi:hypothetical protein
MRGLEAWLTLVVCAPAFAQSPESEQQRPITYGVEIAFRSGHADRGYLISDRPVIQPVVWLSARGADFSAWSSLPVTANTDGSLPQILELELTRELEWKNVSFGPAARMWFYHDPLSPYSTRSLEGWLYLSYDAGPFRLFTHHSLDVLTYRGAYFGDAGIESAGRLSQRLEMGGSLGAGWGSARFNDAWFGVVTAALNRIRAEGWLTAYVTPQLYIGPRFEFNTTVNRRLRAANVRPTYLLMGLTVGGEF